MDRKILTVFLIVSSIIVLDQATKWLVAHTLPVHGAVPIFDSFFHITHERNTGAAFSLLAEASPSFRQPFFLITTIIAVIVLLFLLRKVEASDKLTIVAIAGILGGAIGNFIDRVLYGEVIDFLLVHWRQYHWPAFNVADSCITVGVLTLLFSSFKESKNSAHRYSSHC
jgi:signal peptidase II